MKKLLGIFGIVIILMGSIFVIPVLGNSINEDYEELELDRKILLVIGGKINVCWHLHKLYGFGVLIYTNGETLTFTNYSIDFTGIPLFINNLIIVSFCFYKPAD